MIDDLIRWWFDRPSWFDDLSKWEKWRVRATRDKERVKITIILNASATVTVVHICTVTVAIVYLCTILHPLIWVFFWSKCVKWRVFCILQDFASTNYCSFAFNSLIIFSLSILLDPSLSLFLFLSSLNNKVGKTSLSLFLSIFLPQSFHGRTLMILPPLTTATVVYLVKPSLISPIFIQYCFLYLLYIKLSHNWTTTTSDSGGLWQFFIHFLLLFSLRFRDLDSFCLIWGLGI